MINARGVGILTELPVSVAMISALPFSRIVMPPRAREMRMARSSAGTEGSTFCKGGGNENDSFFSGPETMGGRDAYDTLAQPLELHHVGREDGFAVAPNEGEVVADHPQSVRVEDDVHVLNDWCKLRDAPGMRACGSSPAPWRCSVQASRTPACSLRAPDRGR